MRLFFGLILLSTTIALVAACGTEVDIPGSAGASTDGECPPANPGMCAPSPVCENGLLQTGSASCVNGAWVCEVMACMTDAGAVDSSDAACAKAIHADHYDQSCGVDSDCKAVYSGDFCDNCICMNAAIATSALAAYQSDVQALGPVTNACDCPFFPLPICKAGVCVEDPM